MPEHRIGTQEEWQAERDALLAEEKELTRRNDELAGKRRELPWVPVDKDYQFETTDGTKSLAELFDGRAQLLVYHFMFGPPYEAGCTVCSSIADTLNPQVAHLKARDVTLICSSRAPLDKLLPYRERMGWSFNWVSTVGSDFHRDLGFAPTEEQLKPFLEGEIPPAVKHMAKASGTDVAGYVSEGPGLSAYALSNGNGLQNLRQHCARSRVRDGFLRAAGPGADGAPRGGRGDVLAPAPRRVRDGVVHERTVNGSDGTRTRGLRRDRPAL